MKYFILPVLIFLCLSSAAYPADKAIQLPPLSGKSDNDDNSTSKRSAGIAAETALDRPDRDHAAVLSWAAIAASEIMSFGFDDYQGRLQQSSKYFTKAGWEAFAMALQRSRIIDSVSGQEQILSAQLRNVPVIEEEGPVDGKYHWKVRLSLAVDYSGVRVSRQDTLSLLLDIERTATAQNPNGIGIVNWRAGDGVDPPDSLAPPPAIRRTNARDAITYDELDLQYPLSEFGGIGVIWSGVKDFHVGALVPGMPAEKAGILPGDAIIEVEGKSTKGETMDAVIGRLRGEPGSKVELAVRHAGSETPVVLNLVRARIFEGKAAAAGTYAGAMTALRLPAEKGEARAQNALGAAYESGLDGTPNNASALKWYKRAAQQGNPQAEYNLGMLYYHRKVPTRGNIEVMRWIRKAAESNDRKAQYMLGKFYADGTLVRRDYQRAFFWLVLAEGNLSSKISPEPAQLLRETVRVHLTSPEVSDQIAAAGRWLERWRAHGPVMKPQIAPPRRSISVDLPLDHPGIDDDRVAAWTAAAVTRAASFGYLDYAAAFQSSRKSFTPEGEGEFQTEFRKSGLFKSLVQYEQTLVSAPASAPRIQALGAQAGVYRWKVDLVLVQAIRAGNKRTTRYVPLTVEVVRGPATLNPEGIAISGWSEGG